MTRICVFSDSHGHFDHAVPIIETEKPDMVLHLGDSTLDVRVIERVYPTLKICCVTGNDEPNRTEPEIRELNVEKTKIFMTHGHLFNVKNDKELAQLREVAMERDVDVVLFGHTHRAYYGRHGWSDFMNPGTIGSGDELTYGVLTIDGKTVAWELKHIDGKASQL